MDAGALRQRAYQHNDQNSEDQGCAVAADGEASMAQRLVQEVAKRRPKRPREDEGRPEQGDSRDLREKIERGDQDNRRAENESAAGVPEIVRIRIQSPSAVPKVCENKMVTQ